MTSEVLMLNKDAVVIAADSAVTTGRDPHPRYSKTANKIFDLTIHGNVAVTIYASADIDQVSWELVLKQYRQHHLNAGLLPHLEDYVHSLMDFLECNDFLFPSPVRDRMLDDKFYAAAVKVLTDISLRFPDFADPNKTAADRTVAAANGVTALSSELISLPYNPPMRRKEHQDILAAIQPKIADLARAIAITEYKHADAAKVAELAVEYLVKKFPSCLSYTGLVIAGYGANEVFPSFVHLGIMGHVGNKLVWTEFNKYAMTHDSQAYILPFAQSSMIDRFTDGFDSELNQNIHIESFNMLNKVVAEIRATGVVIDPAATASIIHSAHTEFMEEWRKKNWEANLRPLRQVLNSLSVSEMGHLAESLLTIEELRERVTSPSESIGGPIDVAAITKAEGLIWLKRKHFFDPRLNSRYMHRANCVYNAPQNSILGGRHHDDQ